MHSSQTLSVDSIHEASHVILGAYVGGAEIRVILDRGKPRCTFGHHLALPSLVMSYAGYAGDQLLSQLAEADCLGRSQSDRGHRQWVLQKMANPLHGAAFRAEAERRAFELVRRFSDEIHEAASVIEHHMTLCSSVSADAIEQLECVIRVRAVGKAEGETEAKRESK